MTHKRLRDNYDKSFRRRAQTSLEAEGLYHACKTRDMFKLKVWVAKETMKSRIFKTDLAKLLGVARQTLYNWINKVKQRGFEALVPQSFLPHRIARISPAQEDQILALRKLHHLGCEKIAYDVDVSHMTVYRVLVKHKEIEPRKKRRRKWKFFERKHANSLWQIDMKNIVDDVWSISVLDDHSRFIVGTRAVIGVPHVEDVCGLLDNCISRYGKPRELLTDHGTQFYAVSGNLSTFDLWCVKANIRHILAGVKKPTTIGKVEAGHRMLEHKFLARNSTESRVQLFRDLGKYIHFHNYDRPHFAYEVIEFAGMKKRRKVCFLPFLRYANHRKTQITTLLWKPICQTLSVK